MASDTGDDQRILEPYAEIPAQEKWLFENKLALDKIIQGIVDFAANAISEKDSFAKYIEKNK